MSLSNECDRLTVAVKIVWGCLIISFILFMVVYFVDEWSKSGNERNGFSNFCFERGESQCCQTFEDRGEETPGWIDHSKNSMIAAWFFIILMFIMLCILSFCTNREDETFSYYMIGTVCFFSFVSALCIIIPVGVYNDNYESLSRLDKHNPGTSFIIAVVTILIFIIVPIGLLVNVCCYNGKILKEAGEPEPESNPVPIPTVSHNVAETKSKVHPEKHGHRARTVKQTKKDLPENWTPMDSDNMDIILLDEKSTEYRDVKVDFIAKMEGSCSKVHKIERIQNETLYRQYIAKKKQMDTNNKPGHVNERVLWHGTSLDAIESIHHHGFNRSYCGKNAVMYGEGVYFAVTPTYSANSMYARPDKFGRRRIYRCKVLTGEFTEGKKGMKVPPQKSGAASHILFDSVADDVSGPDIFVIFNDTQAYPEYLIVYE